MTQHQPYPPSPFYDRLTLLSKLEDGWLNGEGKAPTAEALKAASVLGPALPRDVYLYVYPTEAGGVSLEWTDRHGGHEIEVLPDGHLSLMTVERAMADQAATQATFAAEMRDFCSPHGVAVDYADRIVEAMDRAAAADRPVSSGVREVRIVVQAPTDENAASWAETIRDLVLAEHGQDMRLDVTIYPGSRS